MQEKESIDDIRRRIFRGTEGNVKQAKAFEKYNKRGIHNKLLMWMFAPDYYMPYPVAKLLQGLAPQKNPGRPDVSELSNVGGPSEIKLARFFAKLLKETDVFYDIGANYGFYTLLASNFCEVHSFEPIPVVFDALKKASDKRVKKGAAVFLTNAALSDKTGQSVIHINSSDYGSSTMIESRTGIEKEAYAPFSIRTIKLDEYVRSHSMPTVMKVDVEGAESMVIEGGIDFLKSHSPVIGMEVWGGTYNNLSMPAVRKLLELGYNIYKIDLSGDLEETDEKYLASLGVTDNFIFRR